MDNQSISNESWIPTTRQIRSFRTEVLTWFGNNARDLPWRRTRDPYRILVSEIMLQQTQVSRVLPYYESFVERFPTTTHVAAASTGDVLRAWQGLGYNRRALYLKRAAEQIERGGGNFPTKIREIERLPGVGPYTARAVACFAFDLQVAVVETNVRKAILDFAERNGAGARAIDVNRIAGLLVPPGGGAWSWNQAMIDLGSAASPRRRPAASAFHQVPFPQTDRYWRGRIIATLCSYRAPVSIDRLLRELPADSDQYRVRSLLHIMDGEGLIDLDERRGQASLA